MLFRWRWQACPMLGLMVVVACARPVESGEGAPRMATSRQPLTGLSPVLTLDIHRATRSAAPEELVIVGGRAFFSAEDGVTGRELYVSDGTAQGTVRVADIFPGAQGSTPQGLTEFHGQVYFFARSSSYPGDTHGAWALWKSNGTEAGTVRIRAVNAEYSYLRWELARSGGLLFFSAMDEAGSELWKSDGTPQGTMRLKDLVPGRYSTHPKRLLDVNGTLFFNAATGPYGNEQLWKSDGTEAGTALAGDLVTYRFVGVGSSVFFLSTMQTPEGEYEELWRTDGTAAGTVRVKRLWDTYGNSVVWMVSAGGRLFLMRSTGELWTSNGTEQGTVAVRSFRAPNVFNPAAAAVGGTLYFAADGGTQGLELWTSDGTQAGTRLIADIHPGAGGSGPSQLREAGGLLYFSADDGTHGRELWRSNGVATTLVRDIVPGGLDTSLDQMAGMAGGQTVFFLANDRVHGQEVWKTDGTPEGTSLLRDIAVRPEGSGVSGFTRVGNRYFFAADDSFHGRELWVTDGTLEGTRLLGDFALGSAHSNPRYLTEWRGSLFFVVDTANGSHESLRTDELWKTDGTPEGTVRLAGGEWLNELNGLMELNGELVFREGYNRFWKTDGTPGGTVRFAQVGSGFAYAGGGNYEPPARLNGVLYYNTFIAAYGSELWRTDGTPGGTFLVKDIVPGDYRSSDPQHLIAMDGTLFFTAYEEAVPPARALWKSDGTGAGTEPVITLDSGLYPGVNRDQFAAMGGALYFMKQSSQGGFELWKTDGTPAGTVLVREALAGAGDTQRVELTVVGQTLFFVAGGGPSGQELWRSDGTPQGTREVKDIRPRQEPGGEEAGSPPIALTIVNGQLYFAVDDGESGEELWRSDGTAEGTVRVADLNPGPGGSHPRAFVAWGEGLLAASADETVGFEPRLLLPVAVKCPAASRLEATSSEGVSAIYPPVDLADGLASSTPIHYNPPPGSVLPLGSTAVQVTVDAPGYSVRTCSFTATVADTTAPALQCPPSMTVESSDPAGAAVEYPPVQVTDSVSAPHVTYSIPSGSVFPYGKTKVEITATDAAGNAASCSFDMTVSAAATGGGEPEGDSGCSCGTASPALAWWVLLMLGPSMRRRVARAAQHAQRSSSDT